MTNATSSSNSRIENKNDDSNSRNILPVDIVINLLWRIIVDYDVNSWNIDSTSNNIGGNEDRSRAFVEKSKGSLTFGLLPITMNCHAFEIAFC